MMTLERLAVLDELLHPLSHRRRFMRAKPGALRQAAIPECDLAFLRRATAKGRGLRHTATLG